jgi:succinate dehydrogenase/fumarate reductase cytochrome b subunit (b558 family)
MATMTSRTKERLSRLHAITGVLPVGIFLAVHLWINAKATQGPAQYGRLVSALQTFPGIHVLEVSLILLPLSFHAGFGAYLTLNRAHSLPRPYAKPWTRSMQRLTGALTLVFLIYHLCEFRLRVLVGSMTPADFFPTLTSSLSSTTSFGIPAVAGAYLLGLAATSYHFANGLASFCVRYCNVATERGSLFVGAACTAIGAVCFLVGANTVVYFATGGTFP